MFLFFLCFFSTTVICGIYDHSPLDTHAVFLQKKFLALTLIFTQAPQATSTFITHKWWKYIVYINGDRVGMLHPPIILARTKDWTEELSSLPQSVVMLLSWVMSFFLNSLLPLCFKINNLRVAFFFRKISF